MKNVPCRIALTAWFALVPAFAWADESATRVLPTEMCRGMFFVPVKLAEREGYPEVRTLWFIYDTGNEATVVDPDSLARVTNRTFKPRDRVTLVDATAGPVTWNRLPARAKRLDHLSLALGRRIDGILHFDAFGDHLVTLDYQDGVIRLDDGRLPAPDDRTVFSSDGPDQRPWLVVEVAGERRRVLIDSGAGRIPLKLRDIDEIITVAPPRAAGATLKIDHVERNDAARVDGDLVFGDFAIPEPIIWSTRDTQLMGGEFMRHFRWTFDGKADRVRIRAVTPPVDLRSPPVDGHGLVLVPRESGLRVHEVVPGTAAAGSGIEPGDVITAINGQPLLQRDCQETGSKAVTYTVLRSGQALDIEVPMTRFVE